MTPKCSQHQFFAGRAHPALHLVENEKHLVLVANPAERAQPFAAEMIVAAFALNWLDDDRGDVVPALFDELHDLGFRFFLALNHVARARVFA